jgi:hypothetical protein
VPPAVCERCAGSALFLPSSSPATLPWSERPWPASYATSRPTGCCTCPRSAPKFPELPDAAAREQMSYCGFLAELVLAEYDDRARRRSERGIKAAAFPRDKSLRLSGVHVVLAII